MILHIIYRYTDIVVLRKAGDAPGHKPLVGFLHAYLICKGNDFSYQSGKVPDVFCRNQVHCLTRKAIFERNGINMKETLVTGQKVMAGGAGICLDDESSTVSSSWALECMLDDGLWILNTTDKGLQPWVHRYSGHWWTICIHMFLSSQRV